ncbi:MAG: hypothetical protein JW737_10200 [Acidobacteria bacterium]|nr:hypothetical protein [Acidobacteriota bacterium]
MKELNTEEQLLDETAAEIVEQLDTNQSFESENTEPETGENKSLIDLEAEYMQTIEDLRNKLSNLEKMKTQEMNEIKDNLKRKEIDELILNSAAQHNFIQPEDAKIFLSNIIRVSGEEVYIDNKKIIPRKLDESIHQLITELGQQKTHLLNKRWKSGSGAGASEINEINERRELNFKNFKDRKIFEDELKKMGLPIINPVE